MRAPAARRYGSAVRARVARCGAAAAQSLPGRRVVENRTYVPGRRNVAEVVAPELLAAVPEMVVPEPLA